MALPMSGYVTLVNGMHGVLDVWEISLGIAEVTRIIIFLLFNDKPK